MSLSYARGPALLLASCLVWSGCSDSAEEPNAPDVADVGADVAADTFVPDATEDAAPDTPDVAPEVVAAPDRDNDGLPDDEEVPGDADGDGIENIDDPDSDDDGLLDGEDGTGDPDGDGLPNFADRDSDNDGFEDGDEGTQDPDGDGLPNHVDTDSDDDTLPDAEEGSADSDGDGLLDRVDFDSDNDGLPDRYELRADPDADGIPARLDLDSDGDGWSDAEEYGQLPGSGLRPIDSDRDSTMDFLDLDSDADGLGDDTEFGCPDSTERTLADSDSDGFSDLLEVAFETTSDDAGQACDPDADITDDVDFFFELRYLEDEQEDVLDFDADVRRADVAFNMDTTGSMGGVRNTLRDTLVSDLIPTLDREIADSAYAFSQFDDFPCDSHGNGSDRPFILQQRVTTDVRDAIAGVNRLDLHAGGDSNESGFESIYQLSTGIGRDVDCLPDGGVEVEPFNPAVGFDPESASGTIGGVGFREGALPIIVHFTDAASHAKSATYPYGASRNETFAAMRAIGARLIAGASGTVARNDLEEMAVSAGSVVPTCAWSALDVPRPATCDEDSCCTGANGVGLRAVDGMCPLVYDIGSAGSGLVDSILQGVKVLINFSTFDLSARVRRDPESEIDTSRFLTRVTPVSGVGPDSGCVADPTMVDRNRDGVMDGFDDVVPGSRLTFDVVAINEFVEPTNRPQVFVAYIDIVQQGGAILDTQIVTVLVPPTFKPR